MNIIPNAGANVMQRHGMEIPNQENGLRKKETDFSVTVPKIFSAAPGTERHFPHFETERTIRY
jgi:hypothetical protein